MEPLTNKLRSHVPDDTRESLCTSVIPALVRAIAEISKTLRNSLHVSAEGTSNAFGDDQLNVDVLAEKAIRTAIAACPSIVTASSEEDPHERPTRTNGGTAPSTCATTTTLREQYTIAFDPLDGSSIIAPNWSVGTIIGIWDGPTGLNVSPVEKQIGAILGVYGPRTTVYVALRVPGASAVCFEVGVSDSWDAPPAHTATGCEITRDAIRFLDPGAVKTRYFSPANLRAAADDTRYMDLIQGYIKTKYTLRYSGGLVPDVAHSLVKGQGVYLSPATMSSPAKLRRLYELCPIALVVECAGGMAVESQGGANTILATPVGGCDERAGLVCGSTEEVQYVVGLLL